MEQTIGYISNILTILGLVGVVWKASSVKAKMDEATALQQKDIDNLKENKKDLWKKVNLHDSKISDIDVALGKLVTAMESLNNTLQRIEKKIG